MITTLYIFLIFSLVTSLNTVCGSDIFHQKSRITFQPDNPSSYFGYTVVLTNSGLLVGAPKATSRVKPSISPGLVFTCRLSQLNTTNVTCYPLGMDDSDHDKSIRRVITVKDFFRNDMWFGATIATVPDGKMVTCAPRWADPYKDKHLLANGACYVETKRRGLTLTPLKDQYRLAYKTDGVRKEYGEYGTHLNFYAYGQAGMSIKVTENNSIIIGAPGLLQWTGGIIDYRYSPDPNSVFFSKQPIAHPYFAKELSPDDYFGYSVESGIFDMNGSTLYVAGAPRSKMGYGQVLIFEPPAREIDPLNVRAKVRGPQLGSYFGATLCCTDLNGDGRSDLLVGAPNYVRKDGDMPYDQGAVFIYLASGESPSLELEDGGYVSGVGESGARFGSAIAALGDVDGDGYNDIAIGAPWENDGLGAVYIYKGSAKGLRSQFAQRITADDAKSFGMSISRGFDVDGNNCSDLAIGAHNSGTAYLYRCVPTIQVHAYIKVPDAMNLPKNATSFSALFCITVPPKKSWSHVKTDLTAIITIDPEGNRAMTVGDSEYRITAKPGNDVCDEQVVEVKPTADLSKPILMKMDIKQKAPVIDELSVFHRDAARLSENSTLHTSFLIQLIRDCGEDLICTPWLEMTLDAFDSQYVPGTNQSLGAKITVFNKEEPAYGAKVYLQLPLPPKRVPSACSLDDLNMTCDVPAPLERGDSIIWDIELEYSMKAVDDKMLKIVAELKDPLYRNITADNVKHVEIAVVPMASFSVHGKTLPNATVAVTREKYNKADNVSLIHYFEITNHGPSNWHRLHVLFNLAKNVTLASHINGCETNDGNLTCAWAVSAKASKSVAVPLKYDLGKYGQYLEEETNINVTTTVILLSENPQNLSITTMLVLDPAPPIWPHIVGSIAGLLLLAAIVYGLYKYGFFSRTRRDELKKLQETPDDIPDCSSGPPSINADESTQELLSDDSD
ncbi:integrin alpha-PS3-like isoform X2 [Pectinophora gossypiella]|uniref:integrin alpha-PS3-like isoform X2 n=1 Tax=Pectinophora gossypiella TaxID=13191 RepID=UPI00214F0BAF|nr:integrin alpha-PS3-like isoform X2 [Pectinophora gossypiella]